MDNYMILGNKIEEFMYALLCLLGCNHIIKIKDLKKIKTSKMPPGCAACGNPAYPNCKASCPMFDD